MRNMNMWYRRKTPAWLRELDFRSENWGQTHAQRKKAQKWLNSNYQGGVKIDAFLFDISCTNTRACTTNNETKLESKRIWRLHEPKKEIYKKKSQCMQSEASKCEYKWHEAQNSSLWWLIKGNLKYELLVHDTFALCSRRRRQKNVEKLKF